MAASTIGISETHKRARRRVAAAALAAGAMLVAGAVHAQSRRGGRGDGSVAVVQPLPGERNAALSAALVRLGRDPRDAEALIDAGQAALDLGDAEAAIGFFSRADRIRPGDSRIEAGLAGAKVRGEDPYAAIPLFDAAEKAGQIPGALLADRGLAYDLVGDNANAQKYYREALSQGADDEVVQRLALSQAIAGDRQAAETTLAPLLQKQERAAWRTRAFALAILGREEEAVAIVKQTMPQDLALGIAPYLRYMRQLTPAQQAAAANLGHFPKASEIGHDDPRVAQFAPARPTRLASADAGLVPAGEPLGKDRKGHKDRGDKRRDNTASATATAPVATPPPDLHPSRVVRVADASSNTGGELPPVAGAAPITPAMPGLRPVPPALKPPMTTPGRPSPELAMVSRPVVQPPSQPPFQLNAPPAAATLPASPPAPAPVPSAAPPAPARVAVARSRPAADPGFSSLGSRAEPSLADRFSLTPGSAAAPPRAPAPAPSAAAPASQAVASAAAPVVPAPPASAPPSSASSPAPASPPPVPQAPAPALATAVPPGAAPAPASPPPPPVARAPAPSAPAPPPPRPSFADAFAAFTATRSEAPPPAGAIDLRRIKPTRPAPPPPPPPPPNPSRIWVQVGVGRDTDRLAYDWRRLLKDDPELFKARKAWVADWGRTNRLLVGPFETEKAAEAFNEKLHKADHGGTFVWTSPAGQVVDGL